MTLTNGQQPLYATAGAGSHQQPYGTLPDGTEPLIFLDFKNGVYQVNGENAALGSLLVEDETWGIWNTSDIQAGVGLVGNNYQLDPEWVGAFHGATGVFTGEALTLLLNGATVITTALGAGDTEDESTFRYAMTDDIVAGETFYSALLRMNSLALPGFVTTEATGTYEFPSTAIGRHKFAHTMISGAVSASIDGGAVVTTAVSGDAAPWPVAPQDVGIEVELDIIIESIGLYPAQDDADLPALSAL